MSQENSPPPSHRATTPTSSHGYEPKDAVPLQVASSMQPHVDSSLPPPPVLPSAIESPSLNKQHEDEIVDISPIQPVTVHAAPPQPTRRTFRLERDHQQRQDEIIQFQVPSSTDSTYTDLWTRVPLETVSSILKRMNALYIQAEQPSWSLFGESLIQCCFCFLPSFCIMSRYQQCMRQVDALVDEMNELHFHPAGLHMISPTVTAHLFIEIQVRESSS